MVKPSQKSSFIEEVWVHVEAKVKSLQSQIPAGKSQLQWQKILTGMKQELETVKEFRNAPFNLAQLLDPGAAAIPEDVLEMPKIINSAKYHFWDAAANCPKAPKVWPRGRNVPIAVLATGTTALQGPFQHYGHGPVIAGFFWAFGQTIQNPDWKDKVEGFEKLCVNALADYKLVQNQAEVNILAFNAVEENEESRENDGFTGTRKALLVVFAVKNLQKEKKAGQKWTYQEVHDWLRTNIKFHDEKAIPSAHTCKDLYALATDFIKNRRAFAAYQEAEQLWGRSTMFDEYSKLIITCQKSRGEEDLAFIAEWLLADMKAHSLPPKVPDNPSQSKLKECGGPISVAQAARDALISLLQKDVPSTWAPFAELLQKLAQPSRFLQMFPPGGQTPETTIKLVAACPPSLKQALTIMRRMFDGSKNNMWREKVVGHLNSTRNWNIPEKKLLEIFEVFTDEWDVFKDTRDHEAGRPAAKKITAGPSAGDEEKHKADEKESAGKTTEDKQKEKEDEVTGKKEEIMGLARQKAEAVYTNPGVVVLTPQKWECAALGSLMGAQKLTFKEQGGFIGFWFAGSDREARVHTDQNKCLREAPLKKARLSSFCQAIDGIMAECQDVVVIGVGRVKGNDRIVQEVVADMKWQYKTIDAVMERTAYDEFIRSGNPAKKRKRSNLGCLGTTKYKEVYYLCWKTSPDKPKRFPIKSGLREFVDKGSSIASDIMLNCPQVALDEIYAVPVQRKIDALGADGLETMEEAEQAKHDEDLTLPPHNSEVIVHVCVWPAFFCTCSAC